MQAIKLKTRVGRDHRIEIELPPDVPEGEVEVIVLVEAKAVPEEAARRRHLEALFAEIERSGRPGLTKEQIDRYIAEERASWEE